MILVLSELMGKDGFTKLGNSPGGEASQAGGAILLPGGPWKGGVRRGRPLLCWGTRGAPPVAAGPLSCSTLLVFSELLGSAKKVNVNFQDTDG